MKIARVSEIFTQGGAPNEKQVQIANTTPDEARQFRLHFEHPLGQEKVIPITGELRLTAKGDILITISTKQEQKSG